MARGDALTSPWIFIASDYIDRRIIITVSFNEVTKALNNAVIHRDDGCLWTKIVLDNPSDQIRAKRISAGVDGSGDRTISKAAMASVGLNTIDDILAVQITAE